MPASGSRNNMQSKQRRKKSDGETREKLFLSKILYLFHCFVRGSIQAIVSLFLQWWYFERRLLYRSPDKETWELHGELLGENVRHSCMKSQLPLYLTVRKEQGSNLLNSYDWVDELTTSPCSLLANKIWAIHMDVHASLMPSRTGALLFTIEELHVEAIQIRSVASPLL